MADVYSAVADLDPATQERLAGVLETRGADPAQQEMRQEFLRAIPFPAGAGVLEVGCGTGVQVRRLATWPAVRNVVGVDPAPFLIQRANELAGSASNTRFEVAAGEDLPFAAAEFDVVVFDSTLCHMTDSRAGLSEAYRVLKPGGTLAAFDGDYATTTVALTEHDPLQACVRAMMATSVNDPWLIRRLPGLLRDAGFDDISTASYGYVDTSDGYMVTIIDRGADTLCAAGNIGPETAAALKAEARRRVQAGTFFGHIAYGSAIARKP